eukprot:CAMPEP_0202896018 /NCGR_PEP_ID=MMETSP1392-20130828/5106_1 /ASSEMBLY_ACC=CAM_ASM_000868 /TAXON_ID=225041 /ORGANISM="Chlamydomonas chlamydogama, Strain SAG 11-48b" /LENGTH=147 /DNA_ID=CAMNT_0049581233 /DNA_START=109 /DNA_END=552 /DNA_ORIENTATION=-
MKCSTVVPRQTTCRWAPSRPLASPHQRNAQRLQPVRVTNVNQDNFATEVLKSDKPVLVDFWANWCGPCKLVAPLMDWAEKEYKDIKVVKVEHDANPNLISQYKVYGLPTLILFKDGVEITGSKREGAVTKAMLQAYLKQHGVVGVAP